MAFCRVVFPLLVLSVISCYASNVPVIIWGDLGDTSAKAGPLTVVDKSKLEKIINDVLVDDPLIVVFKEETLSVEDFSRKNDETSFPYLQGNIHKAIYLPAVEDPALVLQSLEKDEGTSIVLTDNNGLIENLPAKVSDSARFVTINLKDADEGETRPELLRRHDLFMQNTMSKLQKHYGNVVAIYTAENPSWVLAEPTHSRVRRATRNTTPYKLGNIRLNVKTITLMNKNTSTPLTNIANFNTVLNESMLYSTLFFENANITLNFHSKAGYWFFDSVTLEMASLTESLLPVRDEVYAIEGFSYRCAQNISFASVNQTNDYTINFENLKVQPFFEILNDTHYTPEFGDSLNCVGFFTAPIWAGLFVVFILLLITFYGIMMMMDIRTMDRFDDPKGKTITINAGE